MDLTTNARMIKSLTSLAALFNRPLTREVTEAYCNALSDLTPEALARGFSRAMTECESFPPPATLRKLAGALRTASDDTPVEVAWHAVLRAIRSVGVYSSPEFDEPAIAVVIQELGGWKFLCDQESDQLHQFIRPQFLKAYTALKASGIPVPADGGRLVGELDRDRIAAGHEPQPAVRIETHGRAVPRISHGESRHPVVAEQPRLAGPRAAGGSRPAAGAIVRNLAGSFSLGAEVAEEDEGADTGRAATAALAAEAIRRLRSATGPDRGNVLADSGAGQKG